MHCGNAAPVGACLAERHTIIVSPVWMAGICRLASSLLQRWHICTGENIDSVEFA